MDFNFNLRARRSIRLKGHDYSTPGDYFVTMCTLNRECLLGTIQNGEMKLSLSGEIVTTEWLNTPKTRLHIEMGPFIVMPNHLHGIITIHIRRNGPRPTLPVEGMTEQNATTLQSGTIGAIIGQFKSMSTKKIQALAFPGFSWQRNYYEHIIRNQAELRQIEKYIAENPQKWSEDQDNPQNI